MFVGKSARRLRAVALTVREGEQVKLRLAQNVVDASAFDEEVGHSVSGLHLETLAVRARAQRSAAVVDAYLRNEREEPARYGLELDELARHAREDGRANQTQKPIRPCGQLEEAVGRLDKPLGVRLTLLVVSLQELPARVAFDDEGEFPSEVVSVLNAGVHALRAHGAVYVRGVSGDEAAALGELVDAARVNLVEREPVDLRNLQLDARLRLYL